MAGMLKAVSGLGRLCVGMCGSCELSTFSARL